MRAIILPCADAPAYLKITQHNNCVLCSRHLQTRSSQSLCRTSMSLQKRCTSILHLELQEKITTMYWSHFKKFALQRVDTRRIRNRKRIANKCFAAAYQRKFVSRVNAQKGIATHALLWHFRSTHEKSTNTHTCKHARIHVCTHHVVCRNLADCKYFLYPAIQR